jgi:hypothetical protein
LAQAIAAAEVRHQRRSGNIAAENPSVRPWPARAAYPDFPRDALEKGELDERRVCKTLSYCTYLMRRKDNELGQWPTGCPPFDKEGYGEIMKAARAKARAANPTKA